MLMMGALDPNIQCTYDSRCKKSAGFHGPCVWMEISRYPCIILSSHGRNLWIYCQAQLERSECTYG